MKGTFLQIALLPFIFILLSTSLCKTIPSDGPEDHPPPTETPISLDPDSTELPEAQEAAEDIPFQNFLKENNATSLPDDLQAALSDYYYHYRYQYTLRWSNPRARTIWYPRQTNWYPQRIWNYPQHRTWYSRGYRRPRIIATNPRSYSYPFWQ